MVSVDAEAGNWVIGTVFVPSIIRAVAVGFDGRLIGVPEIVRAVAGALGVRVRVWVPITMTGADGFGEGAGEGF